MDEPDLSPGAKPAFASRETAEAAGYPGADDRPTFDAELEPEDPSAPSPGYITRYREVARLHASGQTNNEIAAALGYNAPRISIILKDEFVQKEVARWRALLMDSDVMTLMKQGARDATIRMLKMALDPDTKDETLIRLGTFFVEQTQGKARQGIDIKSSSLDSYYGLLEQMLRERSGAPALPERAVSEAGAEAGPAREPDPVEDYWAKQPKRPRD